TLAALGLKLNDYWREKKEKKAKERAFQALERKSKEGDTEETEEEDDEEEEEEEEEEGDVTWIQCEDCLKWRGINTLLFAGSVPDPFRCCMHPIPRLQSCLLPEDTDENAEVRTPSYEKTLKKQLRQEHASIKRRGRSLEMSKSPVRPLCRGLSEPASESKQDEVTVIMTTDTQDAGEDGVRVADTEEESSPSPRKRRKETCSDIEKGNKSPNHAEAPDVPSEGETETMDKMHEGSETNTSTSPAADTVAQEDSIQPEATVLEGSVEPQTSQGPQMAKDQLRIPPHPLSPHTSTTMAQTVVVTPLSRPGFQPVSPLLADGSDRTALAQRLAQLEREAKRLKRILGIRELEVAMVTEAEGGGPSDVTTGDSVSCEQNAERLNPMSVESRREELSVCQKSDELATGHHPVHTPIQQEAETSPRDELYWSKTLAKTPE
ncbi:hypothetical protein cypCar_00046462, partial [Cyprinus carpio]